VPTTEFSLLLLQTWKTGQDQVAVIKKQLVRLLPGIKCFLDVDDLKNLSMLEEAVQHTQCMVFFLSGGYFLSPNCIREVKASDEASRPPCLLHEADPSKGGAPLAQLRYECPEEHRHYIFQHFDDTPRDVIPWLRLSAYQTVSMRQIIERILLASPTFEKEIAVPLLMHGDITRHGMMFHALSSVVLCTSENNPGAAEVLQEFCQIVSNTKTSEEFPTSMMEAKHAILKRQDSNQSSSSVFKRMGSKRRLSVGIKAFRRGSFTSSKDDCRAVDESTEASVGAVQVEMDAVSAVTQDDARKPAQVGTSSDDVDVEAPATIGVPASPAEPENGEDCDNEVAAKLKAAAETVATANHIKKLAIHSPPPAKGTHLVLYLNDKTFVGEAGQALEIEVQAALDAKIPIAMIHENDIEKGGCPFDRHLAATPAGLRRNGLYNKIAIAVFGNPSHREVGFLLLGESIGAIKCEKRAVERAKHRDSVRAAARLSISSPRSSKGDESERPSSSRLSRITRPFPRLSFGRKCASADNQPKRKNKSKLIV